MRRHLLPHGSRSVFGLVLVIAVLFGCAPGEGPREPGELTFEVDTSLTPDITELPGFEDGTPRPIAVVAVDGGAPAAFVADELWIQTDDEAALGDFLARWNGTLLSTFEPDDYGIDDLPAQHLVRVDTSLADRAELVASLRELDARSEGRFRFSSDAGIDLLAAGSAEAAAGLAVGMNWIGEGDDYRNRNLAEAPTGQDLAPGVTYQPNPFGWPSHALGGQLDIGVGEAWRALDIAGKLGNRVHLAILDMGFQPDADTPSGWLAIANVPFADPIGTENLIGCGSSPCPWHGTNAVSAAMARPGNGYGAAGPAGPVADAVLIFTLYDFFTSITGLGEARLAGARIANMSYSAGVHWALAWSVLPFEGTTAALRATGMLLFASAGNSGVDVDKEDCTWGACWERTWYTPCENAGVICVGGTRPNNRQRASGSNFGAEQVDLFAPYTMWVGPDPANTGNTARAISGTSFSSPFAAGVAALVWAANPNLSANQVENILISTAHPGGDASSRRIVNAFGAVKAALGNVAPLIEMPATGTASLNQMAYLDAMVSDVEDPFPCCTINWTSSVDGPLGQGRQVQRVFTTLGPRTITVTATDSAGATSSRTMVLTIGNDAPEVALSAPLTGAQIYRTATTQFRASATDRNEPDQTLACNRIVWTSSVAGDPFPQTGCKHNLVFTTNGTRTLTVTATDPQGAVDTDSISVTVVDPPANLPPFVEISSPTHLMYARVDEPMALVGAAVDPEGATDLTYRWTIQHLPNAQIEVATTPTASWVPDDYINFGGEGTYVVLVRLFVTDPAGMVGTDQVRLEWMIFR